MTIADKPTRARVEDFNAGRDPQRVELKYQAMRKDAFGFLRGACHLFYEDLDAGVLPEAPLVWCSGDLHLQNFGTYRGDNRLTYFDINDFDESCLAPATFDLVRCLASIVVAGRTLKMSGKVVRRLETAFLSGYTSALRHGKALWVERATAQGEIKILLTSLKRRTQKKFLASRTELRKGRPRLVRGPKAIPLAAGEHDLLTSALGHFAKNQATPERFHLLDAARRVGGTGSLGLPRYVLLVEGKGAPNGHWILDLKAQFGSCVARSQHLEQPHWPGEADRVVTTQREVQAVPPALLAPLHFGDRTWVLRELMPTDDRLDITKWSGNVEGFISSIRTLGEVVAWGNLRTAARRGAAQPDDLIRFGSDRHWHAPLLQASQHAARHTEDQWHEFAASF